MILITEKPDRIGYQEFHNQRNPDFKNLVIPDGITKIGSESFHHCRTIEVLTIPKTVRIIEDSAFADCENLKTINFSEGLLEIGLHAFRDCEELTTLRFPKSLKTINTLAFRGCINLDDNVFADFVEMVAPPVTEKSKNYIAIGNKLFDATGIDPDVFKYVGVPVTLVDQDKKLIRK